jgi:hypothetical protein
VRAYEVRAATGVIKALQAEEAKVRLEMARQAERSGEKDAVAKAMAEMEAEGLSLSRRSAGKRPFNASKTKDIVTSPFARTAEEVGAAEGAAANRGTAMGTRVERSVRDLLKRKLSTPELENALNSLRKHYKEKYNLSPANFMRIASGFDDRIKDLVTVDITTAAQQRQRRTFMDRPDVRSSEGEVGTPSSRPKTVKEIVEEHAKRKSGNRAAALEDRKRYHKAIMANLRRARGETSATVAPELRPEERTQEAGKGKGPFGKAFQRAEAANKRSLEGKRMFAEEDLHRRVAARLKQLMDPRLQGVTRRLMAQPANRAKYGDFTPRSEVVPNMLMRLLEEHIMGGNNLTDYFGPNADTGVAMPWSPRAPVEERLRGGPPVETEAPDLGALLKPGTAGRPVQGPTPAPAPRQIPPVEARLSAKILKRLKETGSYKRPTRRR